MSAENRWASPEASTSRPKACGAAPARSGIRASEAAAVTALYVLLVTVVVKREIGWGKLLTVRETWAYALGKFLIDPIWWFYLFWLPSFLKAEYQTENTAMALPVALVYLVATLDSATANMLTNDWHLNLLLMAAGIVTTIPLLCFAGAAVRIPLSMLGFFQYIGPSIMFILAVSLFNEPFDAEKGVTFGFIWLALIVYSLDAWLALRKKPAVQVME
mgnify:CR=1 FL=1